MSKSIVKSTNPKKGGQDGEKGLIDRECTQVYADIKRWKGHDGAVLLPVVRKGSLAPLQERTKPKWYKMKKSSRSTVCVTTPQNLQREIDSTASHEQVHELFLLISRQVDLPELKFDVPSTIDNLYIIRCGQQLGSSPPKPSSGGKPLTDNKLILNGASTFCGVRLDEWQTKRAGEHNIILGPSVVIQLQMGIPWTAGDALAAISKKQREEVCQHFREMCETKYQDTPEWEQWKEPVNKLLDVAAGSATLTQVVECYASGIVVQAATRLTESGIEGAIKVSAGLLCLSGPGKIALAGMGAAAAIYFVPWDTVWAWFRAAFGALLTWLLRAWENFKKWVASSGKNLVMAGGGQKAVGNKQHVETTVRSVMLT